MNEKLNVLKDLVFVVCFTRLYPISLTGLNSTAILSAIVLMLTHHHLNLGVTEMSDASAVMSVDGNR